MSGCYNVKCVKTQKTNLEVLDNPFLVRLVYEFYRFLYGKGLLVGGFNPFETYACQNGNLPQIGVNIKNTVFETTTQFIKIQKEPPFFKLVVDFHGKDLQDLRCFAEAKNTLDSLDYFSPTTKHSLFHVF